MNERLVENKHENSDPVVDLFNPQAVGGEMFGDQLLARKPTLSRRQFLGIAGLTAGAATLAACGAPPLQAINESEQARESDYIHMRQIEADLAVASWANVTKVLGDENLLPQGNVTFIREFDDDPDSIFAMSPIDGENNIITNLKWSPAKVTLVNGEKVIALARYDEAADGANLYLLWSLIKNARETSGGDRLEYDLLAPLGPVESDNAQRTGLRLVVENINVGSSTGDVSIVSTALPENDPARVQKLTGLKEGINEKNQEVPPSIIDSLIALTAGRAQGAELSPAEIAQLTQTAAPSVTPTVESTKAPTPTPTKTITSEPTSTPAPPEEIQELVPEGGRVVRDEKTGWWVAVDTKGRGKAIYTQEGLVKMKLGSLVQINDKWYRFTEGKLIEWDIWEPAYKVDFVGTVKEGDIELRIPFSLGLMPDITERLDLPVVGISENEADPYGVDKLAWLYLRLNWLKYSRDSEKVEWTEYLKLVQKGEGLNSFPFPDKSSFSWNGSMSEENELKNISPLSGFTVLASDSLHQSTTLQGWELVEDSGRVIVIKVLPQYLMRIMLPTLLDYEHKPAVGEDVNYSYAFTDMVYAAVRASYELPNDILGGQGAYHFSPVNRPNDQEFVEALRNFRTYFDTKIPWFLLEVGE